jgi:hypothetical protein
MWCSERIAFIVTEITHLFYTPLDLFRVGNKLLNSVAVDFLMAFAFHCVVDKEIIYTLNMA